MADCKAITSVKAKAITSITIFDNLGVRTRTRGQEAHFGAFTSGYKSIID